MSWATSSWLEDRDAEKPWDGAPAEDDRKEASKSKEGAAGSPLGPETASAPLIEASRELAMALKEAIAVLIAEIRRPLAFMQIGQKPVG